MPSDRSSNRESKAFLLFAAIRSEPERAAEQVLTYLNEIFPKEQIIEAFPEIGSATALNSVNGRCKTADGQTLFFKFHTEENEAESLDQTEMYRGGELRAAGWNVIAPVASESKPGFQCVLYPFIDAPTMYSTLGSLDLQFLAHGAYDGSARAFALDALSNALESQAEAMLRSLEIADRSLPAASIHQLFSHRIHAPWGGMTRLDAFYPAGKNIMLGGADLPLRTVFESRWVINGREIPYCIADILEDAQSLLRAEMSAGMASVVAHGDDHFANQFLIEGRIAYFDPAFAGRMPALLAPVKATAHNVIAHPLWFYEPARCTGLNFTAAMDPAVVRLDHNWKLDRSAPLRAEILSMYLEKVWKPLLTELDRCGALPSFWRRYVRAAVFCSPFLARNISDVELYHPGRVIFNLGLLLESCCALEEYICRCTSSRS